MSSLTQVPQFIALAPAAGSFVAPFALDVIEVRAKGLTGATSTVVAKNGSTVSTITLDGSKNGLVAGTPGVDENPGAGTNQPNDTGVGYENILGQPAAYAPVTTLAAGDVLSITSTSASAGAVSVTYVKR